MHIFQTRAPYDVSPVQGTETVVRGPCWGRTDACTGTQIHWFLLAPYWAHTIPTGPARATHDHTGVPKPGRCTHGPRTGPYDARMGAGSCDPFPQFFVQITHTYRPYACGHMSTILSRGSFPMGSLRITGPYSYVSVATRNSHLTWALDALNMLTCYIPAFSKLSGNKTNILGRAAYSCAVM